MPGASSRRKLAVVCANSHQAAEVEERWERPESRAAVAGLPAGLDVSGLLKAGKQRVERAAFDRAKSVAFQRD